LLTTQHEFGIGVGPDRYFPPPCEKISGWLARLSLATAEVATAVLGNLAINGASISTHARYFPFNFNGT